MSFYRTVVFTRFSPGGGLEVGVEYPIIKMDGTDVIVDSEGRYHEEIKDSKFLDSCCPYYGVEFVDDKTGERY